MDGKEIFEKMVELRLKLDKLEEEKKTIMKEVDALVKEMGVDMPEERKKAKEANPASSAQSTKKK